MRAYVLTRYGGPECAELRDAPDPQPGPGEVLVRVHAAGLNPVDFKTREGKLKIIQRYPLPVVMGNEMAGLVEECGEGVTGFAKGDRVFARMPKDKMGAFADLAVVPQEMLAGFPDVLDFETAASVPLAGLTALQALRDELDVKRGNRVFISGGAGGVGTFAIQVAKWLGATVATTASPRGIRLVERLGADEVIDYTTTQFDQVLKGMDGVFDLLGGETLMKSFGVTRRGGMVVSVAGLPEPQTALKDLGRGSLLAALFWSASYKLRAAARKHGVRYRFLFMHPSGSELAELADLIEQQRLTPIVDRIYPFDKIGEAFAYLESGRAKGKVIVRMQAG